MAGPDDTTTTPDPSLFADYFATVKARESKMTAAKLTLDPVTPESAAEGVAMGRELGLPPGQVMAAPAIFKDQLAQRRAAAALEGAPKLSAWLRDQPVAGAMAKDDLANLSWFERDLRQFADMGGAVWNNATTRAARRGGIRVTAGPDAITATGAASQLGDVGKSLDDLIADEQSGRDMADPYQAKLVMDQALFRYEQVRNLDGAAVEQVRARGVVALQSFRDKMDRVAALPMSEGAAAFRDITLANADNSITGVLTAFASDPLGGAAFLGETAAESLPVIAAAAGAGAVTGSPVTAAGVMGAGSMVGEAPGEFDAFLREKGVRLDTAEDAAGVLASPELLQEAAARGMTKGAVVGLFDAVSGGVASKTLLRSPVGNLLAQGLTQMIFGAGGEAASQKAIGDDLDWKNIVIEALAEGVTAPVEVAAMAGSRVRARAKDAMKKPGTTAAMLDEAAARAGASRLRERSPEDFKRAIEAGGAGDAMVYVPADGLREYFQREGAPIDPEALAAFDIDPATFNEMALTGGRVPVPLSAFAARVVGTDLEGWFRENATTAPDEIAASEAASYLDLVPADLADAYEADLADIRAADEEKAADARVYDQLYSDLRAAGRGTEVASREAAVMTAYFRTQGERMGFDAAEMVERFPLAIRRGESDTAAARRRDARDTALNTLRSGKLPRNRSQTLMQFVAGEGGIQDRGGDVGELEGPRGLVAESAAEIRARESQPGFGGMPAQGRGVALDEMGRRAVEAGFFPELMGETQGLNDGEAADLGAALMEALRAEASGAPRYRVGEEPDTSLSDLAQQVSALGMDPAVNSNDEIITALDTAEGRSLMQDGGTGPRGSIEIPAGGIDRGAVINLFETATLATFFHEAGHFTLEAQAAIAAMPGAPQQVVDDMATIRAYLGSEAGSAFTTEQHETWARSFEAYVMEGKAPSLSLADAFARAKAWLVRLYRNMAGLNVRVTPEVREVMDRMLATDREIAEAQAETAASPLFRDRPPGMSDTDWSTYQRMARRSTEQAEARLMSKTMEAVRRRTEAWWKAERAELRAEVEQRINALPQHRLIEAMANGRYLNEDGEASDAPDVRIDRAMLVDQFGAGVLAEIGVPRLGGKRAIYGPDGVSPDAAAQMFGFRNAAIMVSILQNTGKRSAAIEAETDAVMLDRHGDPFTDGSIETEALDSIHNEQTQHKHVAEARHIAAQMGRSTTGMTARGYRDRAARMLGQMTVREATGSQWFLAAERRAGQAAQRAFAAVARGNQDALPEALQAKERQVLNAALYDLSRDAEREVARARERFRAYDKPTVRAKLDGGYIEQIDAILERYDFRRRSNRQVQRAETLAAFVQRMTDEGREAELAIDDRLMDESQRRHYSRLSLDEMRGLIDTVDNLDHLGRFKQRLINTRRERDFRAVKDAVIGQLETVGRGPERGEASRARTMLRQYLTLGKMGDTIITELDGLNETGVIFDAIRKDIFAAESAEAAQRIEMEGRYSDHIKAHYTKAQITDMARPRHQPAAPERLWAKSEILSLALNAGNEGNFQRVTDENVPGDRRLTKDQVQALVATLDDNDWRFIQGIWDMLEGYSGDLEAVHKRRTGVKMKRVEAQMMVSAPGFVRGGYYPLSYDSTRSAFADRDEASAWDKATGAGHKTRIEVASGMTTTRKSSARGRPVRLDLGVPIEGMRDTIRAITLSEAVDNAGRVLRDGEVKQTFFDRGMKVEWDALELWLMDIASGPVFHGDPINAASRMLKNNLTLMFLAFNLKTTVLQVTGLAQSAAVIGKRNMAAGMMSYVRHPRDMVAQIGASSSFMRDRQQTFNKDFTDRMSDPTRTNPVTGKVSRAKETMAQWGFAPIQLMQYYAVDVPTWAGAFRSRIEAGASETEAVEYADLMVDRAQGGGFMGSRAAVGRGSLDRNARQLDMVRFFTTLGGYMMLKMNRGMLEGQRLGQALTSDAPALEKARAAGNAAMNLALLYVVEGALMGLMWSLVTDDDDEKSFASFMLKETGVAMVGGLPFLRDAIGGAMQGYGAGGMYETVGSIPMRIVQQMSQGENDKALWSAFSSGVGAVTGLPTGTAVRMIDGMTSDEKTWAETFLGKNPLTE